MSNSIIEDVGTYEVQYSHDVNDANGRRKEKRSATVVGRSLDHAKAEFAKSSASMLAGFQLHDIQPVKPFTKFMSESIESDRKLLLTYRSDAYRKRAEISAAGGRLNNYNLSRAHSAKAKVAQMNGDKQAFRIHSDLSDVHMDKYKAIRKQNPDD